MPKFPADVPMSLGALNYFPTLVCLVVYSWEMDTNYLYCPLIPISEN